MAKNTFSTVNVKVVASANGVGAGLSGASAKFNAFADSIKSRFSGGLGSGFVSLVTDGAKALGPLGVAAGGTFAAALVGAKKLYEFTRAEGEKDLQLQRSADSVGFSGSGFSGFEITGGEAALENFAAALPKMNKLLGDAGNGSEEAAKKLARFGISAEDAVGKSSEENFRKIADVIANTGSKAQQTALGMEVFGKSYQSVARLVERGSKGFDADRIEAIARGNAPDEKLIAATKNDKAASRELEQSWDALKGNIASAMSPLLDISAAWKREITSTLKLINGYDPVSAREQVKREDAEKAKQARAAAEAQRITRMGESTDRVSAFSKTLDDQTKTFGMGAREAALYAQKLDLVNSGAINTAKGMEALKTATLKTFELNDRDRAKSIKDSVLSPFDKAQLEIAEAQRLVRDGKLSPDQFARFVSKQADSIGGPAETPGSSLVNALAADSREAASFVLKARAESAAGAGSKDPFTKLQEALQRAASAEEATKENTGKLLEAFEARGGINMISF